MPLLSAEPLLAPERALIRMLHEVTIARPREACCPPPELPFDRSLAAAAVQPAPRSGAQAGVTALAMIGTAAALLDQHATLLAANELFEARLAGLGACSAGALHLTDAIANRAFAGALASLAAGHARGRSLPLPRRGERPMVLHVSPVPGAARHVLNGALAALVLAEPGAHYVAEASLIGDLLDLTPAEARLARMLATGGRLTAAAAGARITIDTARTHLKHIYAKTGLTRQAELVALLAGMGMPVQPEPADPPPRR